MNFLSHLYLSGNSKDIIIGNFIGDFVKGRKMFDYPPAITKGIKLHREIDYFTDNHPIVLKSKDKLRKVHGHYAGVVVDIFYDHFLAANWKLYHPLDLEAFAKNIYKILQENRIFLPSKAQEILPHMISGNWLVNYAQIQGIEQACKGIARRTKFESNMETSTTELLKNYEEFKREFGLFIPIVKSHCETFLLSKDEFPKPN